MPDSYLCDPHLENVNSGLMVVAPSNFVYDALMQMAELRETWSGDQQVIQK